MSNMRNWMLERRWWSADWARERGTAQAAELDSMRAACRLCASCPGPGYVWVAGYQVNGY